MLLLGIMAVVAELQDEVERILRRLNLEETSAVAQHLQIENVEDLTSQREVLRRIQETFDGAANDETKDGMLRDLPIPDAHRQAYLRLLELPMVMKMAQLFLGQMLMVLQLLIKLFHLVMGTLWWHLMLVVGTNMLVFLMLVDFNPWGCKIVVIYLS